MDFVLTIALFMLGAFLLVTGSDFFVKSAASIAKKLGVSEFIIGLTIVAAGTSIPEYSSAIFSSLRQDSGLIIGNIVGANIADICFVAGAAALFGLMKTRKIMLIRDGYIMVFASCLLFAFALNGVISMWEGIIFILLYVAYVFFLFETKKEIEDKSHFTQFVKYFVGFGYLPLVKCRIVDGFRHKDGKSPLHRMLEKIICLFRQGIFNDFVVLSFSLLAVVFGARYFVTAAVGIAELVGVSHTIIGLTIMSLGTTLPELFVSISAVRKGMGDIAIGNSIGSVITNILLIIGTASIISPVAIQQLTLIFSAPFLILVGILLLVFIQEKWYLRKRHALVLLAIYAMFWLSAIFIFRTGA
jgi:cation:H+ antiporter